MNRDVFKSMNTIDRVEWFLKEYAKGKKHTEILKEYGLARNTVSDTFKRAGYTLNKDKGLYERVNITCDVITPHEHITSNKHVSNICDGEEKKEVLLIDNSLEKDLLKMISWYKEQLEYKDELKEMMDWYKDNKGHKDIIEVPRLEIDKEIISGEVKTRSFTIHTKVLDMFNEFSKDKPFSKQDLLGQALLEFIKKYD